MTEINEGGPYKIKVENPKCFTIDLDTSNYTMYESGGYANEVKVPFKVSFKSFKTSLL
jgi:hypothetical protein